MSFTATEGEWGEAAKVMAGDGAYGDSFGYGIALNAGRLWVGAGDVDGDHGYRYGAAYLFQGIGDCNGNGVLDLCDVEGGGSYDANANQIPDECDPLAIALSDPARRRD